MENRVIEAFLYNDKLRFSEIEKLTNLRSNILAYYLKNFEQAKVLVKENGHYSLSNDFEHIIPYVSDKQAILPTVLIAIGKKNDFFLNFREKKPYKGRLGLPAGRILVGENIGDAVKRIMKQKYNINARLTRVNSISLEHIKRNGKVVHSFLLILVSASTKNRIYYFNIEKNKKRMIKSDYLLLKKYLNSNLKIPTIISQP